MTIMALVIVAAVCTLQGTAAPQHGETTGVRLQQWNSSAGVISSTIVPTTDVIVPQINFSFAGGVPFSAEATGTLVVPPGNYSFSLVAAGEGVTAMVWIDGHLVARWGHPALLSPTMHCRCMPAC